MIAIELFNFFFSAQMKIDRSLKEKAEGNYALINVIKALLSFTIKKHYNSYKADKRNNEVFYLV